MPTIEQRRAFCEARIRTKEGRRYSLEGRQWVIDEFWRIVDGFRLWPNDAEHLCEECKSQVGTIVEAWDWALHRKLKKHARAAKKIEGGGTCAGLLLRPIIVTILNLKRREGKTINVAAWVLSTIFLAYLRFVLFVATAGTQTKNLYADNFEKPIKNDKELSKNCRIVGNEIHVPSTKSHFRFARTTSHRAITGGGYSHVVIDEARDQNARVVSAAVFSIQDQNGYECPRGHVMQAGIGPELEERKCPVCHELLIPWWPRIILISSSGIIDDNEDYQWFEELKEVVESTGPWAYHLYASDAQTNPAVRPEITEALEDGFGRVASMRDYVEVELTNRARRKGEDFISSAEIRLVFRPDILSLPGDDRPCVAFLDTSWTTDTTSLAICADRDWPGNDDARWRYLTSVHLMKWKPESFEQGRIDPDAIRAYLDAVLPLFPALQCLLVDDRGMQWAKDLVVDANRNAGGFGLGWGRRTFVFHGRGRRSARHRGKRIPGVYGGDEDRATAWNMFEYRIMKQQIEMPADPDALKEIKGVRRKRLPDGTIVIMDRNRKQRHADIIEAYAGCCFLVYLLQTQPTRMTLDEASKIGIEDDVLAAIKPITSGLDPRRLF